MYGGRCIDMAIEAGAATNFAVSPFWRHGIFLDLGAYIFEMASYHDASPPSDAPFQTSDKLTRAKGTNSVFNIDMYNPTGGCRDQWHQ